MNYFLSVMLIVSLLCKSLPAQDLGSIKNKDAFKVSGGVAASSTFYNASGIQNRRDPFYWMISTNLVFDVYGVSIPFSATFTQQQKTFTQPFNQYGVSPTYKSLTLHLGYRSMQFSNYTLAGNIFLGVGIEVKPKQEWIKYSVLYGRFSKAINESDSIGISIGMPSYERWGYGSKLSLGKSKHNIDLIFFKAKDDLNSISAKPEDLGIETPGENLVLGVNTKHQITEHVNFDLEYAYSVYNTDIRALSSELSAQKLFRLGRLFTPNASAQFNKAIVSNINYTAKGYNLKMSYRRIDPNYRSMGTPFLNNDLEDISGNVSWKMLKNKINSAISVGVQRNNLDNSKSARMIRLIGALNMGINVSEKINMNFNFSNFSTNTRMVVLNQIDSLNYFQITRSAGTSFNYSTGTKDIKHNFNYNTQYQTANDIQENHSVFYNTNIGYQYIVTPKAFSINTSLNINITSFLVQNNFGFGPTLGFGKQLNKKKIRLGGSITNLYYLRAGKPINNVFNIRLTSAFKIDKHQNLSMNIGMINRKTFDNSVSGFTEVRLSAGYNYNF